MTSTAVGAKVVINLKLAGVCASYYGSTVFVLLQYPELKLVTFSSLTIFLLFFAASFGGGGDAAWEGAGIMLQFTKYYSVNPRKNPLILW